MRKRRLTDLNHAHRAKYCHAPAPAAHGIFYRFGKLNIKRRVTAAKIRSFSWAISWVCACSIVFFLPGSLVGVYHCFLFKAFFNPINECLQLLHRAIKHIKTTGPLMPSTCPRSECCQKRQPCRHCPDDVDNSEPPTMDIHKIARQIRVIKNGS